MKIKIIFVFVFLIVLTVNSQITTKKVTTTPQLKFKQQQKVTLNKNSVNFTATKTTLKQNATNTQKLKGSTTTAVKGQSTTIKKTNPKPTTAKVSNKKFEEWKKTYGKVYKTQKEETAAEQNFSRCANKVQKLNNQPGGSFKCSLNADSDMNYRQKVKYRMGLRVPNEHSRRKREVNSYDIDDFEQIRVKRQDPLPDTLDLREFLTPIKNQGICGSCWAFSVATVLEYEAYLISGKIMSLSEQEMLDCNTDDMSCDNGGWPADAMKYVNKTGLASDEKYEYLAYMNECANQRINRTIKITNYCEVFLKGEEDSLKYIVYHFGPQVVAYYALEDFSLYKSGIYNTTECIPGRMNHAIVIVGYGTDPDFGDYWLIRNSWGTSWGEDGYGKIARGDNLCAIAEVATGMCDSKTVILK